MKEEIRRVQNWIKEQVTNTRVDGVVLGLSGGIDSTVVAYLAVGALGADKVTIAILPCESSTNSEEDAMKVIKALNLKYAIRKDLSKSYSTLKDLFGESTKTFVNSNIKSRLRMITLYAISNQLNRMVIGTTNKTELFLGYYTKYGDGGVDIEPIVDYYKGEIYEMAKELGVPESIINKVPTADIGITLTDEEEFSKIIGEPITYNTIDSILKAALDDGEMPELVTHKQTNGIMTLMGKTEHKRNTPPFYERIR